MSPNPQAPAYKEGIRLRKSTILHPTDFGQISLFANEPAERRRSAGEAAENSAARRMFYAEKFSIDL